MPTFYHVIAKWTCLWLALATLFAGCASPLEKQQRRAAEEERRRAEEQLKFSKKMRRAEEEQKRWREVYAAYTDEQLRFKLETLDEAIARGTTGMNILLRTGNGIGVLIAQGQIESKVKERDAAGMELARRKAAGPERLPDSQTSRHIERSGTGFFITEDGYLVTSYHVVHDAQRTTLKTSVGEIEAKVVAVDKLNDLAILKADGKFSALPIAQSRTAKLGDMVFTLGFPNVGLQGLSPKLTRGEISSLKGIRDDPREFQISVPVQPGNSGGALVDERGNVVGVVSGKLGAGASLRTAGALPENVNYAMKSTLLLNLLESMPEVSAKLKDLNSKERKFEELVTETERAAVLVLVY